MPIVHDELTGYSLIGVLASMARLRFTGMHRLTCPFHPPGQKGTFLLCLDSHISKKA